MYKSTLTVDTATPSTESCDGCGRDIQEGEFFIDGIASCCGGCYRHLCFLCVKKAKQLVDATELLQELTWNRELLMTIEEYSPQLLKRLKEFL